MKLRAKANGAVVSIPDVEADAYLSTGLYDQIEEESTKVEPLSTNDMPLKKSKKKGA